MQNNIINNSNNHLVRGTVRLHLRVDTHTDKDTSPFTGGIQFLAAVRILPIPSSPARCRAATISFHGRNSSLSDVVLIHMRHDEDDDTSPGGHAKIDCHGDGDGDAHGNGGGYGEITAILLVLVMAMAMMMVMAVAINTRQRSHQCNLILCLSHRKKVTTLRPSLLLLTHGKAYGIPIILLIIMMIRIIRRPLVGTTPENNRSANL